MSDTPHWYLQLRGHATRIWSLNDGPNQPSERLLQAVWLHQRLLRDRLRTADGRRLEVIHPGFPQAGGGPDFQNALVRWEDGSLISGDVEVDVQSHGWRAHGHAQNPRFAHVILHVVWESSSRVVVQSATGSDPPVLAVREYLDAALDELALWLDRGEAATWPENLRGACYGLLTKLPLEQLVALLQAAALARMEAKAVQFQHRARQVGWEQALWEGLFHALGYKHNTWPMRWLAERKARWWDQEADVTCLQARLLGMSGLLPVDTHGMVTELSTFARRLWDVWWRDRDALEDCCLPRRAWHLHAVRPANHPERRLALAAHWLARPQWIRLLESWITREVPASALLPSLMEIMNPGPDPIWSRYWTLRSAGKSQPQGLIGRAHLSELALNVILPWLGARARSSNHLDLWRKVQERYLAWPAAHDHAVLRMARQRILGGRLLRGLLHRGAIQQGLVQITRDFCDHADARCTGCVFPAGLASRIAASESAL
ncbi:MAG: DUF2851 family protein [Verrucomicrobiota bacterium]|nr:DUF2851 family protein [Limisphaera sp.]MDW8382664.1 DUF2851 family protein [Verrucomicrobiota bacterium]